MEARSSWDVAVRDVLRVPTISIEGLQMYIAKKSA
jgi:hypothetical protein